MASADFDTLCCRLYLDGYFEYLDGYLDTDDKSLFLADQLVLWPVLALTLSAAVARHSAPRASVYTRSDVNLDHDQEK